MDVTLSVIDRDILRHIETELRHLNEKLEALMTQAWTGSSTPVTCLNVYDNGSH